MKEDQIQILLEEVDRYKKEKKEAMTILKNRDIELQRANQKVLDLQKLNTDFSIMQSKLLLQKDGTMAKGMSSERLNSGTLGGIASRADLNKSTLEPARHQGIKLPEIAGRPSS